MIETVLIAFLAAKIKKFKLKPFFKSFAVYPMAAVCVLYIVIEIFLFNGIYSPVKYVFYFKLLFFLSVFLIAVKYKLYTSSVIGSVFVLLGSLANYIAIKANNGKMPVFISLSKFTGYVRPENMNKINDIHILGTSNAKLKFLTDIFDVGYCIMSIGDILIRVFVFIIVYKAVECANSKQ